MNTRASPTVQLPEDWLPRGITEVGAAHVGEQRESVHVEAIAAVGDLGDGGIDVGQRQCREQPEPTRMVDHSAPTDLVGFASEIPSSRLVSEVNAGRRDRQHRRGDPQAVHRGHVLLLRPGRHLREAVGLIVTRREQSGPVGGREVMGVDVDLVRHSHTSRDLTQSSRVST